MKKLFFIITLTVIGVEIASGSSVKIWHEHPAGGPDSVKAEGYLPGSPESVWDILYQPDRFQKVMPRILESIYISKEGIAALQSAGTKNANKLRRVAKKYATAPSRKEGKVWQNYFFMVVNTPFPVENRWYVLKITHDETKSLQHVYKRCWELIIGNVNAVTGCWTLAPHGGEAETFARYEDTADIGGKVPHWMAKMGAEQTVPQIFKRLEKALLKEK